MLGTTEEKYVLTVKAEDEGNDGVTGEKPLENTIEGKHKGISIYTGRLKIGPPNKLPATEVLVVRKNLTSWV